MVRSASLPFALLLLSAAAPAPAAEVGHVVTSKGWTYDSGIVVDSLKDPLVPGVACWVSRAVEHLGKKEKGLLDGDDKSDASIACRQVGPITVPADIGSHGGEEVFTQATGWWAKEMHVTRFFDPENNSLVYLTYSTNGSDGSPKNSLSTVPIQPWGK